VIALIKELKKQIWKFIDVICYFAGLALVDVGAFKLNIPVGYIVTGVSLLVSGYLIDLIAGEKGGDN
jgi:Na+-translocating ferredoxin:NAD+ oxidoreductase RnfD subunit